MSASAPEPRDHVAGEAVPARPTSRQKRAAKLEGEVEAADLPIIDLNKFMGNESSEEAMAECRKVAEALHTFGCLIVRDPRVSKADNDRFVDTMERYFEQPQAEKEKDMRPDLHYQVGATPNHTERPRNHCAAMAELPDKDRPLSLCPPELDPKWRFFWNIGSRPEHTSFADLNSTRVEPEHIPEFPEVMDTWGNKMLAALEQLAVMAAQGFGVEADALRKRMKDAPHLLAPTGSNFYKYNELGTVLAGYHYDLNFLTIHGRSRFPGLYIWLRDGRRKAVKVPEQCLLVQAGKQFEYISGGHVLAGFHEVVVSPATQRAIDAAKAEGRSCWRVSSTLFGHLASDTELYPLPRFVELIKENAPAGTDKEALEREVLAKYPRVLTGDQVQNELKAINLNQQ